MEAKKKRTRRKFTPEFKAEAVRLVETSGRSPWEVARDVTNEGGTLHVTGMIDGALKRVSGSTTIEPGAVIQGKSV